MIVYNNKRSPDSDALKQVCKAHDSLMGQAKELILLTDLSFLTRAHDWHAANHYKVQKCTQKRKAKKKKKRPLARHHTSNA